MGVQRGFEKGRIKIIVLFVFFAALFFAGCFNPTESDGPATRVLVVHIAGEAPAARTALPPAPAPVKYAISVTRPDPSANLGSASFAAGAGSYPVELTDYPAAGDLVQVEGLDGGDVKIAGGTYALKTTDISGNPVSVTLLPLTEGTGNVRLKVSFDRSSADGEITLAELKLYASLQDYKNNNDLGSAYGARHRKNDGLHGTGTDFSGSTPEIIPIEYDDLPCGNYVVMIEFFRDDPVSGIPAKVSRLVQTIIVRGSLTTNSWDGGPDILAWDAFASSNAELADIQIDGTTIYDPATLDYKIYAPTTAIPATKTLTVVNGEPGQAITVNLNKVADVPLVSGVPYTFADLHALGTGSPLIANTLDIKVTAPDGFTEKHYMINISGKEIIDFYFVIGGKSYGVRTDVAPELGSGDKSGNNITVTVPYGTTMPSLPAPVINHSGNSISTPDGTVWVAGSSKTYTVSSVDTTETADYTVTVEIAKIKSIIAVNGNFLSPGGGFIMTGSDISATIKGAITSVTGTDGLDTAIDNLAAGDYSVDPLTPTTATAGTTVIATLRVPGTNAFEGSVLTKTFDVYIKNNAKEITDFYFTIDQKKYGYGTSVTVESGSGGKSGNAITVNVPYAPLGDLAPTVNVSPGASSSPSATWGSAPSPHTYTVTAEDGTSANYDVTVNMAKGVTVTITGPVGFADLTLSVSSGPLGSITITGDKAFDSCHIYISGPVSSSSNHPGPVSSVTFTAPTTPGFYNINVIVTKDTIPYSGSFGWTVE